MPDIDFRFAWQKSDPDFIRDARAFWLRLRLLNEEQLDERAAQLCALAYSGGELAAISTVDFFGFLRGRFFHYRTTVAPEFRRQAIAARLCRYSWMRLAE